MNKFFYHKTSSKIQPYYLYALERTGPACYLRDQFNSVVPLNGEEAYVAGDVCVQV